MKLQFEQLPKDLEQFESLIDLKDPKNTCALFLMGLNLFTKNKELGIDAINLLKGSKPLSTFEISFLNDRLIDKPYLPLVYFDGATMENDYTPTLPYTLTFYEDLRPQDVEDGYLRLYLKTKGADSKRAIKLREKTGNWYIWEYPGIVMDVRKPKSELDW